MKKVFLALGIGVFVAVLVIAMHFSGETPGSIGGVYLRC